MEKIQRPESWNSFGKFSNLTAGGGDATPQQSGSTFPITVP